MDAITIGHVQGFMIGLIAILGCAVIYSILRVSRIDKRVSDIQRESAVLGCDVRAVDAKVKIVRRVLAKVGRDTDELFSQLGQCEAAIGEAIAQHESSFHADELKRRELQRSLQDKQEQAAMKAEAV